WIDFARPRLQQFGYRLLLCLSPYVQILAFIGGVLTCQLYRLTRNYHFAPAVVNDRLGTVFATLLLADLGACDWPIITRRPAFGDVGRYIAQQLRVDRNLVKTVSAKSSEMPIGPRHVILHLTAQHSEPHMAL
ncbi:MAG: hypothetical protein WA796_06080, partial [Pseudolabrys sp.]